MAENNPTPTDLATLWHLKPGPGWAIEELYDEGLTEFWTWLTGDKFDVSAKTVFASEFTPKQLEYHNAAIDLLNKMNALRTMLELDRPEDPLYEPDSNSLVDVGANWPKDNSSFAFYNNTVVPVFLQIIEDLKVIQENILISAPDAFNNAFGYGSGPFAWGDSPPKNLGDLIDAVVDSAPEFLKSFPEHSIALKRDIPPLAESQGLGSAPIFSDANLEASLRASDPLWPYTPEQTHYIGFLIDPEKSDGERDLPFLPARLAPEVEGLTLGWDDPNYSLIHWEPGSLILGDDGGLVKPENKESDGIEIPLGLEITVTEIVPSRTGIWVGFVSDDARLGSGDIFEGSITNGQRRVVYTKAQYVRIKESAEDPNGGPDPYLSEIALKSESVPTTTTGVAGSEPVLPGQNWINIEPNDVRMEYYSFNKHNLEVIGKGNPNKLFFNTDTIKLAPTLRYSEGYFYFITGAGPRKTEAELINEGGNADLEEFPDQLNEAKNTANKNTFDAVKEDAWNTLLNYLGKNTEGGETPLRDRLYDKYFVLVDKKVNTNSADPNNQKILFAIRTCYVDSLPDVRRPYTNDFENESPFLNGENYAVALPMKEVRERCRFLQDVISALETQIFGFDYDSQEQVHAPDPAPVIENVNGLVYDLGVQYSLLNTFPDILDNFFKRQSFPASTNRSFIYDMVSEGTNTTDDHLIQIGIKDNKQVGADVRETISYILFSPDPKKLKDSDTSNSNLFYFDPYLTKDELEGRTSPKRSALPLRIALPWLHDKLEGAYFSRLLHLFLSHDKIKTQFTKISKVQDGWMDFMSRFIVPPVKIFLSKDPVSLATPEKFDCDEAIRRMNKSGPNVGLEEKLLQEKIFNRKDCQEKYFNQYKTDTFATSPELSKKELEEKQQLSEQKGSIMDNRYIKRLYDRFFNVLNTEALIAMIMACLEAQLGIEMTAEAICEAAILELVTDQIRRQGNTDLIEKVMFAQALLTPTEETSLNFFKAWPGRGFALMGSLPEFVTDDSDKKLVLDGSYNNAPIATSMILAGKESARVIRSIKKLEKKGVYIQLVPGIRPAGRVRVQVQAGPGVLNSELDPTNQGYGTLQQRYDYHTVSETYTQQEIDIEKQRLEKTGYSKNEARAKMVVSGHLRAPAEQGRSFIENDNFYSSLELEEAPTDDPSVNAEAPDGQRAHARRLAARWLAYWKGAIGLQPMCELIVGDILNGLKDLIRDPGSFFGSGENADWWDNFIDSLKKQFSLPPMTLSFPWNLPTDNHMGDYAEKLFLALLGIVADILAQIVNLLIQQALDHCLEELSDIGPGGREVGTGADDPSDRPDISIPILTRADLPKLKHPVFGRLSDSDIVDWMKGLLDGLTTAQLCALLRGDATEKTLQNCLAKTKAKNSAIHESGIDSIYEIQVIFKKLGEQLDLDVCNIMQSPVLIDNLCDASFDSEARAEQLKRNGLTDDEAQKQIDREIADLKSKVSGLTSLSLFGANPLLGSHPPMCGKNGSFVVPPGMQDTMERITDNMLLNAKSALMVDLATLKFFSVPPRSVLAATDPNELLEAHKMFTDAVKGEVSEEGMCIQEEEMRCHDIQTILDSYASSPDPVAAANASISEGGVNAHIPPKIQSVETGEEVDWSLGECIARAGVDCAPGGIKGPGTEKTKHFGPGRFPLGIGYPLDIIPKVLGIFLSKSPAPPTHDEETGEPLDEAGRAKAHLETLMAEDGPLPDIFKENKTPEEIARHFTRDDEKVNKELYEFFDIFPTGLGGEKSSGIQADNLYETARDLEKDPNFNPNILRYNLPFTEVASVDNVNKLTEIMTSFGSPSLPGGGSVEGLLEQISQALEMTQPNRNLINQNVSTPLENNIDSQSEEIKNVSKLIKSNVSDKETAVNMSGDYDPVQRDRGPFPPYPIGSDEFLSKEIYNFNFGYDLEPGVKNLIDELYSDVQGRNIPEKILKDLGPVDDFTWINDSPSLPPHSESKHGGAQGAESYTDLKMDPLNFKAQIFGKFLAKKFMDKFDKYYDHESAPGAQGSVATAEFETLQTNFEKELRHALGTYSYSALQYAYSTQMFTKLKHSRIHTRGMMKKVWEKILRNPLTSPEGAYTYDASIAGVDPRCKDLLDKLGAAPSMEDLETAETDFFDLDDIKRKVTDFYKKSLCQDVYETNSPRDTAANVSLIEGMVMLVAKIYTLEMFLASVIAWDSFDLEETFKEKAWTKIVIQNISKDYDLEFISETAKNILRKEKGLSDIELAQNMSKQSSIEHMIHHEVEKISEIITGPGGIFLNRDPLTTDLQISVLKNSDDEFVKEFDSTNFEFAHSAQDYVNLFTKHGIEYVVDARLKDNIYTMNYGDSKRTPMVKGTNQPGSYIFTDDHINSIKTNSDIYGVDNISENSSGLHNGNKNYLHSLPFNYYMHRPWGTGPEGDLQQSSWQNEDFTEGYGEFRQAEGNLLGEWGKESLINRRMLQLRDGSRPFAPGEIDVANNREPVRTMFSEYLNFRERLDTQRKLLPSSDLFAKENFQELTYGNNLNAKFGNILFQPYVRIEDYGPGELRDFQIILEGIASADSAESAEQCIDSSCDPCALPPGTLFSFFVSANDFQGEFDELEIARQAENNIFNCFMFDYVPLSAWDYYYNNVFMKKIIEYEDDYGNKPLLKFYNQFGLKPFFKKISFGMRMTYSTSFPYNNMPSFGVKDEAFGSEKAITSLKKAKCMFGQRPHMLHSSNLTPIQILGEIQIPIIEVEREIKSHIGQQTFDIGGKTPFDMSELGSWVPLDDVLAVEWTHELLDNSEVADYFTKNPHQFFYKNLANVLLTEIKNSSEFKIMFDYLFPMKRYMALATITASDGLSKFIPEPTEILEKTKRSLRNTIVALANSADYEHVPESIAFILSNLALQMETGTQRLEPNLTKEIWKIILRTPLLILKGFVETTDPAIIIAKLIINIANAVAFGILGNLKSVYNLAKQGVNFGIDQSKTAIATFELNVSISVGTAKNIINTLPSVIIPPAATAAATPADGPDISELSEGQEIVNDTDGPLNVGVFQADGTLTTINIPIGETYTLKTGEFTGPYTEAAVAAGTSETPDVYSLGTLVTIDIENKPMEDWTLQINDLPPAVEDQLSVDQLQTWNDFKIPFEQLIELLNQYRIAKEKLKAFEEEKIRIELFWEDPTLSADGWPKGKIPYAEKLMEDTLQSPFLLPGLWILMFPSWVPLGGGFPPPPVPFPGPGPPSTVPGMIYLILLLIDAIEEKTHRDITNKKLGGLGQNCEDEL
jgi:hypothetical protein